MISAVDSARQKRQVEIVRQTHTTGDTYSCCDSSEEEGEEGEAGSAMRFIIPSRHLNSSQSNGVTESTTISQSAGLRSTTNGYTASNGGVTETCLSEVQQAMPAVSLVEETRAASASDEARRRSNVSLTRYASPQDVIRRLSARRGSGERPGSSKSEPEVVETLETDRLKQESSSKDIIISHLRDELRRLESQNKLLQQQLCESDSFIEQRVAELSRKSVDSRAQWQGTLEENQRLRREAESDQTTIGLLREESRRLQQRVEQAEAERQELQDRLRVANEVLAAHQCQCGVVRERAGSPAMAPIRHENDMLRQQLERQDREITTLRRELGPSRFLLDARSRALPSANDRLDTLLASMETSALSSPTDLQQRHQAVMQRAKAALNNVQAGDAAPVPPKPAGATLYRTKPVFRSYLSEPSAPEQRLHRFLAQQERAVTENGGERHRCRSPGVERLLAKYRGGPVATKESRTAVEEEEEEEENNLNVHVYSLGRKIHDADFGRLVPEDSGNGVERQSSIDSFSGDDSLGLWSSQGTSPATRPGGREPESPPPRSSVPPPPLNERINSVNAKLYANALIDRYINDRRR